MINDNFHNNYKICSAQIKKLSLSSSLSVLVYLYPQFHKEGDQGQDQDHLHLLHGQVQGVLALIILILIRHQLQKIAQLSTEQQHVSMIITVVSFHGYFS